MSDAIRRWRQNDQRNMVVHPEGHYVAYQDHTARIAASEAEVARLQSEALLAAMSAAKKLDAAETERDRLRDALKDCAQFTGACGETARAALVKP